MDMGVPSLFDQLVTRVVDTAASADPLARLDAAVAVAAEAAGAGARLLDPFVAPAGWGRRGQGGAGDPPRRFEATCEMDGGTHHEAPANPDAPHPEVRTEPLLFVLALDAGGRARRVLNDLGTDIASIKRDLEC